MVFDPALDVADALDEFEALESLEKALLEEFELESSDARAPNIAPSKPAIGGAGSSSAAVCEASEALALALLPLPLLLLGLANIADSAVSGYKRFEFDTELTLMGMLLC